MANVPLSLPTPGLDTDTWGGKLNTAISAISGDYLSQGDAAAGYATLDGTPRYVPAPSGGDDSTMLAQQITGSGLVVLRPGATYIYAVETALPAFTGRIIGNGATIAFTYGGTYHNSTIINNWTDVVCEQVTFTAPGAQLFAIIGPDCAGLTFRNCRIFDCSPSFAGAISRDFAFVDGRIDASAAPPATLQQRIGICNAGRFVFENNVVDFAPVGAAGSLLGGTDSVPTPGTTISIRGNSFLASNLAGHLIDAIVDLEPQDGTPYELVTIADNEMWNGKCYLTGANRINVLRNRTRFTSVNGTNAATPWVIYNSNAPRPATGTVVIEHNDVIQDTQAVAQDTTVISQPVACDELISRNNRVTVNGASTTPRNYCTPGATLNRLVIDGDEVTQTGGTAQSTVAFVKFAGTATGKIILARCHITGEWQHLLAFAGPASTVDAVVISGLDFRDLTFSTGNKYDGLLGNNGNTAITSLRVQDNNGLNPLPFTKDIAPTLPATGVAATNSTGFDATVYVSGGTVTSVTVGGVVTGLTSGAFRLRAGQSITLAYSAAPTWHWVAD